MHSATQILALKEWKVGFIKTFHNKPLLVSDDRSLLSYCTVLCGYGIRLNSSRLSDEVCTFVHDGI